jgi:hypothetical protein
MCHSTGMVLRQRPLTANERKTEIMKMRNAFGAPISVDQIDALARYLSTVNGRKSESGPSSVSSEASCKKICSAYRKRWAGTIVALSPSLASGGCLVLDRNQHANALAAPLGEREGIATRDFVLTAFVLTDTRAPLDLYIEGDGFAWLSRSEPSLDPTPRAATGLALAAVDSASNVAYLARPCQFTPMSMNPRCAIPY